MPSAFKKKLQSYCSFRSRIPWDQGSLNCTTWHSSKLSKFLILIQFLVQLSILLNVLQLRVNRSNYQWMMSFYGLHISTRNLHIKRCLYWQYTRWVPLLGVLLYGREKRQAVGDTSPADVFRKKWSLPVPIWQLIPQIRCSARLVPAMFCN